MAGFMAELSKISGQRKKAMARIGLTAPEGQRAQTPPITGPGTPTQNNPPQQVPPPATEQTPLAGTGPEPPLGPVPAELEQMLGRVLGGPAPLLSDQLRRMGTPGADSRHQFFNLFGHMPTPKETAGFALRLRLEQQNGRPPTAQEVKQALASADFIDKSTPDSFGLSREA